MKIIQLVIRLGLLAVLIFWTLVLIRPFWPILAWSVVLAVALNPVFQRLAKVLGGGRSFAATILTVISLAIVIGPATWIGLGAVDGIKDIAEQLTRVRWWFLRHSGNQELAAGRAAAL